MDSEAKLQANLAYVAYDLSILALIYSPYSARADTRFQFIVDLLDLWIPATNLGLVNLNDGVVGFFGYASHCCVVTSLLIGCIDSSRL